MSIYNGFATRQQQTRYNNLLENILIALKKRLMKFYKSESCDQDKFKLLVKKIYKQMVIMEKSKFLAPKYSTFMEDFIDSLDIKIDFQSMSDMSSVFEDSISLDGGNTDRSQYLKSKSVLQEKKNTIKRVLFAEREREHSASYFKNLTHLNIADEMVVTEQDQSRRSILEFRSTELPKDPILHLNNPIHKPIKIGKVYKTVKREKDKQKERQKQKTLTNDQQIKYGVPVPPELEDFVPAKMIVKEKVEELLRQSQSRVVVNPAMKSKEQNRSFRKQKFQKLQLRIGDV